jgi:hypothetical protein
MNPLWNFVIRVEVLCELFLLEVIFQQSIWNESRLENTRLPSILMNSDIAGKSPKNKPWQLL